MPRQPDSQKAFTLIEVLMAATVLVVSFTAVIQAVTVGADMIDTARKQQIAQQIIENEISGLRLDRWSTITSLVNSTMYTTAVNTTGTAVSGDTTQFKLGNNAPLMLQAKGFTITEIANDVRTDFRTITYKVNWTGSGGRAHTRTGVAYFGKNGLQLSYQK